MEHPSYKYIRRYTYEAVEASIFRNFSSSAPLLRRWRFKRECNKLMEQSYTQIQDRPSYQFIPPIDIFVSNNFHSILFSVIVKVSHDISCYQFSIPIYYFFIAHAYKNAI